MDSEEQKFFAWLDGELSQGEAAAMEAKVAADPRLAEIAEQHRAFRTRLKGSFDTIAEAPVPERLQRAIRSPDNGVIDIANARRRRQRWATLPQWAAIAATLVFGVLIGMLLRQAPNSPVEVQGGHVYAAASLDRALDTQLASAPTKSDLRIGLTFRDGGGTICRSFTGESGSGLACRDGDRWQVRGLFARPAGQRGEYRMAAGMDPNLAALIDSTMAGEAFDASAEKVARDRDWR